MSRAVKKIIRAAGMRDELTFTSFRHGGFTEAGDADMTDREITAQGGHTTTKVLPKYVKRTLRQVASGAKKRRASRTKAGHLSE
jgi:ligand-binding sensor domain-containing protein